MTPTGEQAASALPEHKGGLLMWPFGKKKEKAVREEPSRDIQVQNFVLNFLPEEFTILAVTGVSGIIRERPSADALWTVGIELTAWMREDEEEIHRESVRLLTLADARLADYLHSHLPANFMLKARVRASKSGKAFQLIGMPEPGFDPDLKEVLDAQKAPVTLEAGSFGTFTLLRRTGCFEGEVQWQGADTRLMLDQEEDSSACLETAARLFGEQQVWGENIRACAADLLLEQGITWLSCEDEDLELSREELMAGLEPDSIQVCQDGSFHFSFGSGGALWGQLLCVSGSVRTEELEARMEG